MSYFYNFLKILFRYLFTKYFVAERKYYDETDTFSLTFTSKVVLNYFLFQAFCEKVIYLTTDLNNEMRRITYYF